MKKKKQKKAAKKPARAARPKAVRTEAGMIPMGDRVLVRPTPPETVTSFGIIIPDNAKEKPEQGIVVAVGKGRRGDDNELIAVAVSVGDKVLFSKYGYDEVKVDGTEYFLVREENILAVLTK